MKDKDREIGGDCALLVIGFVIGLLFFIVIIVPFISDYHDSYYAEILRNDNKIEQWREIDEAIERIRKGIE